MKKLDWTKVHFADRNFVKVHALLHEKFNLLFKLLDVQKQSIKYSGIKLSWI